MSPEEFRKALNAAITEKGVKYVLSEVAYEVEILAVDVARQGRLKDAFNARRLASMIRELENRIRALTS